MLKPDVPSDYDRLLSQYLGVAMCCNSFPDTDSCGLDYTVFCKVCDQGMLCKYQDQLFKDWNKSKGSQLIYGKKATGFGC